MSFMQALPVSFIYITVDNFKRVRNLYILKARCAFILSFDIYILYDNIKYK